MKPVYILLTLGIFLVSTDKSGSNTVNIQKSNSIFTTDTLLEMERKHNQERLRIIEYSIKTIDNEYTYSKDTSEIK